MPGRLLTRLTLVGVLAAAPLGYAAPGHAAPSCCTVSITSLPAQYQLGGAPGEVATTVSAPPGSPQVAGVVRLLAVRLGGLRPEQVRVEHRGVGDGWNPVPLEVAGNGTVRARDDSASAIPLAPGTSLAGQYRLSFTPGAPVGPAVLALTTYTQRGDDRWRASGAAQASTVTVAAPDAPTPGQPGPPPATAPASAPAAAQSPPASAAPSAGAAASGSPSARSSTGTDLGDLAAGAPPELAPVIERDRVGDARPVSAPRPVGQLAALTGAAVLLAALAAILVGHRWRRHRLALGSSTDARTLGERVREAFGPHAVDLADRHHAAPHAVRPQPPHPQDSPDR